ncbi:MAG: aminomethyl-transferring glycine dehydrogenase subunit GcvPA [Candidatus Aminicenantes bacterium]|nr:aminomethyl-transferring glycine dehydrogenase subunit GcvPA [Candidatus Aminicenantes bacterium]
MSYIALSGQDQKEMLARVGAASVDDLFCCIPEDSRLRRDLDLPAAMTEPELLRHMETVAGRNTYGRYRSFLGGGAYHHYIPTVVDSLSARTEFVSPYTPYQPEVSQGTLQVIFEYQTLICRLTGMDIANASLYDGASAAAEAALMAQRLTHRGRILVARSLHPQYRETIRTLTKNLALAVEEVGFGDCGGLKSAELREKMGPDVCGLILQSPNMFGVVEDLAALAAIVHEHKGLMITAVAEGLSLGILEAPGKLGADIVCGEAQSFGLPTSFGGPGLGFMGCKKEFLRQLPGRICGQTKDVEGKRGFVLTLSTREQHIRREKATSNICSNQGWCALRATIYLESVGQTGLREIADQNIRKAVYAAGRLAAVPGVKLRFSGRTFNEFVLVLPKDAASAAKSLQAKGILPGLELAPFYPELPNTLLVCVTEVRTKEEIDGFAAALEEVLR